jgi:hypothetical protein
MKVYHVTMNAGGTVRLGADRYTEDAKVRFYQGNILHSEFPTEEVSVIHEEQDEAVTLVRSAAGPPGSHRS